MAENRLCSAISSFFCCDEDMPGVAYEGRTMEINYFEIGKSIRDHRIRQVFTQEQLSEYADISPGKVE